MPIADIFRRHGHAAALSGTLLVLAVWAAAAAAGARDPALARASSASTAASGVLAANPAPRAAMPDRTPILRAWSPAAVAVPLRRGGWAVTPRPAVRPALIRRKTSVVEPEPAALPPPPVPAADADPARARLRWAAPAARAGVREVRVWRQGPGDAAPVLQATLAPTATSWDDSGVRPGLSYAWRIQLAGASNTASALSNPAEATIPLEYAILFPGGSDEMAHFVVRKFIKGEWREAPFDVRPRDEETGTTGEIGVSERPGGAVSREFDTRCILVGLSREIFRFTVPATESFFEDGVRKTRQVRRLREVRRRQARTRDHDGRFHTIWEDLRLPAGAEPAE